jgi:hypothetical protein
VSLQDETTTPANDGYSVREMRWATPATSPLTQRDREAIAEIRSSIAEYDPVRGERLAGIEARGSYPDTRLRVLFETSHGRRYRKYAIRRDFDSEELEVISVRPWADVLE